MRAPEPWRIGHGREPEAELRRLNRRFKAVSSGLDWAMRFRRVDRRVPAAALTVIGICALLWAVVIASPCLHGRSGP
jgi:hypothetical protein